MIYLSHNLFYLCIITFTPYISILIHLFNFYSKNKVSLLGAHSLGYVNISNSGYGLVSSSSVNSIFNNAWDSTPHILDNKYFTELIAKVTN